jgi:hypothetical protein
MYTVTLPGRSGGPDASKTVKASVGAKFCAGGRA